MKVLSSKNYVSSFSFLETNKVGSKKVRLVFFKKLGFCNQISFDSKNIVF